jgi:hypothetical protein
LSRVDPRFDVEGIQVVRVSTAPGRASNHAARARFFREVKDSFGAVPGVVGVGGMHALPLAGSSWYLRFVLDGQPPDVQNDLCLFRAVLPDTFDVLGIELLEGRDFSTQDDSDAPQVAVVNRSFVERFLGGRPALGQRFKAEQFGATDPWTSIVGVVEDTVETQLEVPREPVLFLAHAQRDRRNVARMELLLKRAADPPVAVTTLRSALAQIDPEATLIDTEPLASIVARSFQGQRFARLLLAAFALVALIQASAGIFGMAHFQLTSRRRELGLRLALGANPSVIRRRETSVALARAAAGLALGSSIAWLLSRRLESLWVGVSAADPQTYATVAAIVVATVFGATYGPALRASRTDPSGALRGDEPRT